MIGNFGEHLEGLVQLAEYTVCFLIDGGGEPVVTNRGAVKLKTPLVLPRLVLATISYTTIISNVSGSWVGKHTGVADRIGDLHSAFAKLLNNNLVIIFVPKFAVNK